MALTALHGQNLINAIRNATSSDGIALTKDGFAIANKTEIKEASNSNVTIKWKKGSEETKNAYRTLLKELSTAGTTKVDSVSMPKYLKQLEKLPLTLTTLKQAVKVLDQEYRAPEKKPSLLKKAFVHIKMGLQDAWAVVTRAEQRAGKAIRKQEFENMRQDMKMMSQQEQNQRNWELKNQSTEQKTTPSEDPPVKGESDFIRELRQKQKEFRSRIDQKQESGVSSQLGNKTEGTSQGGSKPVMGKQEYQQLIGVLDQLYSQTTEGETHSQVSSQSSSTSKSGDITKEDIRKLLNVLAEVAPDGIGEFEETEQQTHEPTLTQESGRTLTDQQMDQLVSNLKLAAPDGIGTEQDGDLEFVKFKSDSPRTDGSSGPSKSEIDQLANILLGRPSKEAVENLYNKLTGNDN